MSAYDVIVLGVGGMGSAACFDLARRGRRVLGLEQYPLVHSRGSSHGHTRIIRTAYAEHPDYVPLARRAFDLWYELEQITGRHLLTETPCVTVGPKDCELVSGVWESARRHGLNVADFGPQVMNHKTPFRFPEDTYSGVIEFQAGFLYVEDCVRAHIDAAVSLGAEIHTEEPAREWRASFSPNRSIAGSP